MRTLPRLHRSQRIEGRPGQTGSGAVDPSRLAFSLPGASPGRAPQVRTQAPAPGRRAGRPHPGHRLSGVGDRAARTPAERPGWRKSFVGQQLLPAIRRWGRSSEPLFLVSESAHANAETDYLLPGPGFPVPVEVKSGASGSLKSLHQFLWRARRAPGNSASRPARSRRGARGADARGLYGTV